MDLQGYDDGLAVLQVNSLCYIDDAGVEINSHEHTYANPVLRTAGKYALLFDRGGNQFRLEKNAAILNECPTDAAITTADVSKNGTYAYILNAHEGYQSHLYVFDEKGGKQFEWGSAADYTTLFHLAENGKKAVLVSFVTENADYSSKKHSASRRGRCSRRKDKIHQARDRYSGYIQGLGSTIRRRASGSQIMSVKPT